MAVAGSPATSRRAPPTMKRVRTEPREPGATTESTGRGAAGRWPRCRVAMRTRHARRPTDVTGTDETTVRLVRGGTVLATWRLACPEAAGLAMVDELARLQLAARRLGCEVQLRHASPRLVELLDLAGLTDVVLATDAPEPTE